MEEVKVRFQYKGDRDYIQGPDMYNEMLKPFINNNVCEIGFSAHSFLQEPSGYLCVSDNKQDIDSIKNIKARMQFRKNEDMVWLALLERKNDEPVSRVEYEEQLVINYCQFGSDGVELLVDRPFSFIETLVSMKKAMLQRMFEGVEGKWVFTRVDFPQYCNSRSGLAVKFKHNMNFRLLKSDILVDGNKVGDIYFSLVKP